MPQNVTQLLALAIQILVFLIFVDAIIGNIIAFGGRLSARHPVVRIVRTIVDPLLNPVRRFLPPYKTGGWDLSNLIVGMALIFLGHFLAGL
jgi:uncharacterized protein YggT (Ycf19 family)